MRIGKVLECYYGKLYSREASYIPVMMKTTPMETRVEEVKDISLNAKIHKFMLRLMGRHEVVDEMEVKDWIPEALIMRTTTPRSFW